jgi:hypothetical protein
MLKLRGRQVPLDADMAAAFDRIKMRPVWEMFRPSGRIDFEATVSYTDLPGGPPDLDVQVTPAGATVRPSFFPYDLTGLKGTFHYTRGPVDHIELGNFEARHGPTRLTLDWGEVLLQNGGFSADLRQLSADRLALDADLVHALPSALQTVCRAIEPRGTVAVDIRQLILTDPPKLPGPPGPPWLYWDGRVRFAGAALSTGVDWTQVAGQVACQGVYKGQRLDWLTGHVAVDRAAIFDQPVHDLHLRALVDPAAADVLQLLDARGKLFGGQLGGEARVAFGSDARYAVDLKAVGVRLDEVAKHNGLSPVAQLSGLAKAELYLTGTGAGVTELEGAGNLHVPEGRMYNLPFMLDLLKVSALRVPDGTAFEEAHAEFRVHGRNVEVTRLDLLGNAVSLGGRGTMALDGTDVKLDFYAVWAHLAQVLPPGLRDLPAWASQKLFKIRATGRLNGDQPDLKFTPEPVPVLVDPVMQLLEKVRERGKKGGS